MPAIAGIPEELSCCTRHLLPDAQIEAVIVRQTTVVHRLIAVVVHSLDVFLGHPSNDEAVTGDAKPLQRDTASRVNGILANLGAAFVMRRPCEPR